MYTVSNEYKNKIKENIRFFKIAIEVLAPNGSLLLHDKDLALGSFTFTEASQAGEDYTVGGVVASNLSFNILNKPSFKDIIWEGARIKPQVGLLLTEEEETPERWEYVPLGEFYVDDAVVTRNSINIKAIDNMTELDIPYTESNLSYPATLQQIYVNICNVADITVGTLNFPNKDYVVTQRPVGDYTFRDILGFVAELSGTFAKINRNNGLELRWYTSTGLELGPANRFDFKPKEEIIKITGVQYETEDAIYRAGTEDYVVDLTGNPLLQGDYGTVLSNVYNNIKNTVFTPFESRWQGNPAVEAGDIIGQEDRDGREFNTIVTSSTYKYRGASSMAGRALPAKAKGYKGSSTKRIVNIIRRELSPVSDKLSNLEQAQLNAMELMANMLGGHLILDEEEGNIYIANNPDLDQATEYWQWGLGGFVHWKDGVINTGITADSSIVAMLVSAGIITADMVQTGVLQSEDGSSWINLDNGEFNLKNKIRYVDGDFFLEITEDDFDISGLTVHNIVLTNESQSFVTDSTGKTVGTTTITTDIETYRGVDRIAGTIGALSLRNSQGAAITGGTLTKANPTKTQAGKVTWTIPNNTNISVDNGYVLIPITIEGKSYNKRLTWSKTKTGGKGDTLYTWIRYADDALGSGMSPTPLNKKFIGIAYNKPTQTPSDVPGDYQWSRYQGENGIPGEDGSSLYTWIKYADDIEGNGMSDSPVGKNYIGIAYNKSSPTKSTNKSDYIWSKWQGRDGLPGESARLVDILASNAFFTKKTNSITPNNITFTPIFQNTIFLKWEYSLDGTTWNEISWTNPINTIPWYSPASKVMTIPNGWKVIKNNDYITVRVTTTTGEQDIKTIQVVQDLGEFVNRIQTVEQKITPQALITTLTDKTTLGDNSLIHQGEFKATTNGLRIDLNSIRKLEGMRINYIRDWLNGSVESAYSYWSEIQVDSITEDGLEIGVVDLGNVSASPGFTPSNLSNWTDGNINTSVSATTREWRYLQWEVHSRYKDLLDISSIRVKHGSQARKYNHRLEVSEDGVTWFALYDSEVDGHYIEHATQFKAYDIANGISGGIIDITKRGIRVEHTDFPGQYTDLRADGVFRQWEYGEGAYLNDVWIYKGQVTANNSSTEPNDVYVTLPQRFRNRDVEAVALPAMATFSLVSTAQQLDYVVERRQVNTHQSTPQISVRSYTVSHGTSAGRIYNGTEFILFVIGK